METLLLVPVDDSVVFPNMTVTLAIDVGDESRVVLVPRADGAFAAVGTVAEVVEQLRLPGGARAVALAGRHRATIGAASTDPGGELRVEVDPRWRTPASRVYSVTTVRTSSSAISTVLVTERKWAHMFALTNLPERFGTTVISDLTDLTEVLVSASVAA